jgi:hypothetical protein
VRFALGTWTRLFVAGFFLGASVLLWRGPHVDGAQMEVALATAILGLMALVLPSYAACDAAGISLVVLGIPAGRAGWSEIRQVVTRKAPLRRVHVTSVLARGRPRLLLPAELTGYRMLVGEIARRRPDVLDPSTAAVVAGSEKVASLERFAPVLLLIELAAFGYVAVRVGATLPF